LANQIRYVTGIMFVALLVYSGLWYTAAFDAEKRVTATFSQWRDQGLRVEHGKIEHGGYPYRITVTVHDLTLESRSEGVTFSADNLLLVSHLWTPGHWIAEAREVQSSLADGAVRFTDGYLHGSYKIHDNGKTLIIINSGALDDFTLTTLLGQPAPMLTGWELALWLADPKETGDGGLYGTRFLNFKLTGKTASEQLALIGGISGPKITDWSKPELANWRDQGGLLELDTLDYIVGNGRIKGNASLTLDDKFRPLGSLSLVQTGSANLSHMLIGLGLKPDSTAVPQPGPASLMLQNGFLSVNSSNTAKLVPVIK
jgi:Uncharacterized protein conserved in bacteria (DUF2125)